MNYDEIFSALKIANFQYINIGLESGSEEIRKKYLKRVYSNADIINVCETAKRHNLKVRLYNMIGVPGETVEDFKKTVEINRICQPDSHYTGIFFPYPGTELHMLCKEKHLFKKEPDIELERRKPVLDLPGFNKRKVRHCYVWFDYYVYKGYKPIFEILIKVIVARLKMNLYFNLLFRRLVRFPIINRLRLELSKQ